MRHVEFDVVESIPSPRLTLVTPAYNESENLPLLYEGIRLVLTTLFDDWEWIVIDDHSSDRTFAVLQEITRKDPHVRGIRLARNGGSHNAIWCGLDFAQGQGVVVLAADLQDPPELIPLLLAKWEEGNQVVWATRAGRPGEKVTTVGFSRLYYAVMRRVAGMEMIPPTGADLFLLDRRVVAALKRFGERNASLFALISWLGFQQTTISYNKQVRLHGRSGWTLEKRLKLVADSLTSFTYFPIRMMSYLGILVAAFGFVYAGVVIANALVGKPAEGWTSLMVVVLVLGGFQMLMMGVLGEYLWRALDEVRHRPRYLVERIAPAQSEVG